MSKCEIIDYRKSLGRKTPPRRNAEGLNTLKREEGEATREEEEKGKEEGVRSKKKGTAMGRRKSCNGAET